MDVAADAIPQRQLGRDHLPAVRATIGERGKGERFPGRSAAEQKASTAARTFPIRSPPPRVRRSDTLGGNIRSVYTLIGIPSSSYIYGHIGNQIRTQGARFGGYATVRSIGLRNRAQWRTLH